MDGTGDLVSIIIPCHDGQDFVGDAIASALAQTHHDIEVIIIDDASHDRSPAIIDGFARRDTRVKPIFLTENVGAAAARNRGIAAAHGQWIAPLDADDLYRPGRIEHLLDVAAATGAEMVADRQYVHDLRSDTPPFLCFDFLDAPHPIHITPELYFRESSVFHREPNIGYMKPMFLRSLLLDNGLRFNESYKVGEDVLLQIECICRGARFYGTSHAGYVYRRRITSLSRSDAATALRPLAAMCGDIVEKFGDTLSPDIHGLIRKRRRILERFAALSDLSTAARGHAWQQCAAIAARRPDMLLLAPILTRKWTARRRRRLAGPGLRGERMSANATG
jgi:glycosyltransferase involved in cell wall biosynthesis